MMSSAPSCSALSAASRAPSGEPLVSLGISVIFGLSKSNSASSAACFSALATAGVEPEAVMGRRTATFTAPPEPVMAGPGPLKPPPLPPPQADRSNATLKAATASRNAPRLRMTPM